MEILDGFNSPKLACYVCNITALVWIVNSPYDEIDAVLTYACLLYYIILYRYIIYIYIYVCINISLCVCLHLYIYIIYGYESIPINTIFSGMNIHLPAILMFTRGTRF